jgi:hypothetical protein
LPLTNARSESGISKRKDWDEHLGDWKNKPRHDSSSHCCDALRYLAMAWREVTPGAVVPTTKEIIEQMIKPRSIDSLVREYFGELRENGDETEFGGLVDI